MYKKILCMIAAFMLCTNIVFANPKQSINDVETISNSLNTIYLSILQGKDVESIKKDIAFIQSELKREREEILHEIPNYEDKEKQKAIYYSLLSILNHYQISILELEDYHKSKNQQSLMTAISELNHGDLMLDIIKAKL